LAAARVILAADECGCVLVIPGFHASDVRSIALRARPCIPRGHLCPTGRSPGLTSDYRTGIAGFCIPDFNSAPGLVIGSYIRLVFSIFSTNNSPGVFPLLLGRFIGPADDPAAAVFCCFINSVLTIRAASDNPAAIVGLTSVPIPLLIIVR